MMSQTVMVTVFDDEAPLELLGELVLHGVLETAN